MQVLREFESHRFRQLLADFFNRANSSLSGSASSAAIAIQCSGVEKVLRDKRSLVGDRLTLQLLVSMLRPSDAVRVYKIDLLAILERTDKAGASFQSLTEPVDTSTSAGQHDDA